MTRVNLIPPALLCNQHLLAEHREITRIPNLVMRGKYKMDKIPPAFVLGTGHVSFFYNKLFWLHTRYNAVQKECLRRGFNVTDIWPDELPPSMYQDYEPTSEAIELSLNRIIEKLPPYPRFTVNGLSSVSDREAAAFSLYNAWLTNSDDW